MDKSIKYAAIWQGIPLSISYCPEWSAAYRQIYGYGLAHIGVEAPCPLPITETGYRSHFTRPDVVEAEGGPVAFVLAWLDHEASTPAWKAKQDAARQMSLF
jgi:hypothetical protein